MRFNSTVIKNFKKALNYEGAKAFELTPQLELYAAVATSSLSDQFYEGTNDRLIRLRNMISKNDPKFVAKLAIYAREQMHLRSIPLVLTVELAKQQSGNGNVSSLTNRVVQRADELTELLSYYALANERNGVKKLNRLSKQVQKGLADAFNKFDEYQFAKYNRAASITLKDVLFLVHPKAKDEAQQALFDKIVKNELQVPYTWEVELSVLGQKKFESVKLRHLAFKAKWEELILSKKLGYMATLRNLRNMLEAEISDDAIKSVCEFLSNPLAISNSKQLPFRFLSAYRELKEVKHGKVTDILDALEKAVFFSAANIKGYNSDTKVVIAADVSGSMQKAISPKSKIQNFDIGLMLAMLLQSRCENVITGMFGDSWKVINVPKNNVLANVLEFHRREGEVGYSTNGYLVVKDLIERKKIVDKIMLFTDCQLWNSNNTNENIDSLWKKYKQIAPGAKLYLFDLAGYGTTPLELKGDDVYLIAGWSDKIFDVLNALEEGVDAIRLIENIQL